MMEFIVTRTSCWDDDVPPCPEAVRRMLPTYLYLTFKTTAQAKRHYPNREFETTPDGTRSTDPHFRDLWTIELSTLEDLTTFIGKYGSVVVEPCWENNEILRIDIYDDYRE